MEDTKVGCGQPDAQDLLCTPIDGDTVRLLAVLRIVAATAATAVRPDIRIEVRRGATTVDRTNELIVDRTSAVKLTLAYSYLSRTKATCHD